MAFLACGRLSERYVTPGPDQTFIFEPVVAHGIGPAYDPEQAHLVFRHNSQIPERVKEIAESETCLVYLGTLEYREEPDPKEPIWTKDVVCKLVYSPSNEDHRNEIDCYERLRDLQGSSIPICYGLYKGNVTSGEGQRKIGVSCLVLEYCGLPTSFSKMNKAFRYDNN
ncbi:predicted protein [Postia placenta Mad-698-R]|uniref:Uncharacterized protein n=1 Tax=Postia placenta MAD-698-R-SB12 TaxID=670580 RepID=A0A1X6MMH6_9APHY|nr:hypothetical protein POSPLADRAFT_1050116 [Postia placenta MAD-698-R-SB12]EED77885.1 predicted protein [Postia placenta Mad-698-R]OSX57469.1 hypothetical protein POSPLADRAFT_1050116 [Postia placenta MAD-698-R-SB12]